jgi:glycosyltransferase involved in cell wall biosynthesis
MARIALMLESDGPGGAEMMLLHLAEALRARGHSVFPVGPAEGEGWLPERLRERDITSGTFTLRRPLDPKCLRDLVRLLDSERVDVVHSHEFTMAVYGAAAARRLGLPHVITMHGGRRYGTAWRRRAALRWAIRSGRATVAVSDATRAELAGTLGLPPGDIRVIRNGIPARAGDGPAARRSLRVRDDEALILAVGNLYPVKGHIVLLEALARLALEGPEVPWRLAIAGRGEEEAKLRAFADEHGLTDRLSLLGFREDIPDLLAAADVFVMPSLREGLPVALVEAMFAGRPVVASRVGGIPEVLSGEGDALLVPPQDAASLATALRRLLTCPAEREALGRRARAVAEAGLGVDAMAARYEDAYGLRSAARISSRKRSTPVTLWTMVRKRRGKLKRGT